MSTIVSKGNSEQLTITCGVVHYVVYGMTIQPIACSTKAREVFEKDQKSAFLAETVIMSG